jgi:hypothetical protein
LDIAQRDPGIERSGDERVSESVRGDGFGDPGAARDLADDPSGAVPVQPPPVCGQEYRPAGAFADGQVDCPGGARRQRDGDDLAVLAGDGQCPVPAFQARVLDVGTSCFGDAQPVQREQRDQRVLENGLGSPLSRHTYQQTGSRRATASVLDRAHVRQA